MGGGKSWLPESWVAAAGGGMRLVGLGWLGQRLAQPSVVVVDGVVELNELLWVAEVSEGVEVGWATGAVDSGGHWGC